MKKNKYNHFCFSIENDTCSTMFNIEDVLIIDLRETKNSFTVYFRSGKFIKVPYNTADAAREGFDKLQNAMIAYNKKKHFWKTLF